MTRVLFVATALVAKSRANAVFKRVCELSKNENRPEIDHLALKVTM